jgi:hypothetical protein
VIDLPPAHLPVLRHADGVRKQFGAGGALSRRFGFNLPTHYLCFVTVLAGPAGEHGVEKRKRPPKATVGIRFARHRKEVDEGALPAGERRCTRHTSSNRPPGIVAPS